MSHLNYKQYKDKRPLVIILRHAERYPIVNPLDHAELLLTEKGHLDSYELGRSLGLMNPVTFYSSPIARCQQTAEGISKGIQSLNGMAKPINYLYNLGGPYILGDWLEIADIIKEHGINTYLRKWFDGELPTDLLMSLEEAAQLEMQILKNQLEGNETAINITHDWNIMIMRQYFFNLRHEDVGPPGFLDGIIAYMDNEKIYLSYHEYTYMI